MTPVDIRRLPPVLFVSVGENVRVLCPEHRKMVAPKATGYLVSEAEQRQSLLFFDAAIRCEECMRIRGGTTIEVVP